MYIIPDSTVKILSGVRLDNTYNNTINFLSESSQQAYFVSKLKYNFIKCTYVKEQRKLKVQMKADNLYDCNYMMYQNAAYGNKWFYAFILKVEYVNDVTSELTFELDVMQTWHFDYTLNQCFVEREHALTDSIGDNLLPENLELGNYKYKDLGMTGLFNLYQIIVAATFDKDLNPAVGGMYGGVYSGLCYNVFTNYAAVNTFLTRVTEDTKSEGIVSIFMLPIAFTANYEKTMPDVFDIERDKNYTDIDGYIPKNNKLFTAPYNTLYVTNNEGMSANYPFEYFSSEKCSFNVSGVMCCTPECMIAPRYYKGVAKNYNEKLTIGNFAQCSYTVDTFKAYVAQNATRLSFDAVSGVGQVAAGGLLMGATGGLLGSGEVVGGLSKVGGTLATLNDIAAMPPQAKGGNSSILNMAEEIKGFQFYYAYIRSEFAKIIDEFWTMYGYPSHRVKVPNRGSRSHWNYVKTSGCNLFGGIPTDDITVIKNIYNRGITFWKNGNEIGNYNLDNTV